VAIERDDVVIPLYLSDLSMISAQTRSAFVARENRYPLFRIMVQSPASYCCDKAAFRRGFFVAAALTGL